jgi:hypothetical protein
MSTTKLSNFKVFFYHRRIFFLPRFRFLSFNATEIKPISRNTFFLLCNWENFNRNLSNFPQSVNLTWLCLIKDPNLLLCWLILIKGDDCVDWGKTDVPKFLFDVNVTHFCWWLNNKLHNFSCTKRRAQTARFELTLMMIKLFLKNVMAITFLLKFSKLEFRSGDRNSSKTVRKLWPIVALCIKRFYQLL